MTSFEDAWVKITQLLEQGVSVIPIRDKEELVHDKIYSPKTTYGGWKKYQFEIIAKDFLFDRMDYYNTQAIAIICGKVSGNLITIDIDVKHKPGIDILILETIKELMPETFKKIRRHLTPSTGKHLMYRVNSEDVGGNQKIAGRKTTEDEKRIHREKNPQLKRDLEKVWFVETRGEGGYVVAPPSLGYIVENDIPIQTISKEEHEGILNICRNYNEILEEPKWIKPTVADLGYYEENPYNHYSRTADPDQLLTEIGFLFVRQKGKYLWYTRPGGTHNNVHATFNLETRIFYSWTPNIDLEPEKGYYLATLLIQLKFNNDKLATYKYLVEQGFGKVRDNIEKKTIVYKAASNTPPPVNFSKEAKESYDELVKHLAELHPYGLFWDIDEDENISISRKRFYEVSAKLGFRYYSGYIWQVIDKFIYKRDERFFYDTTTAYIKIEDDELKEDIFNALEAFLQKSGEFSVKRLEMLKEEEIFQDTKDFCCKFFGDVWIKIDKNEIQQYTYEELPGLVFAERLQARDFILGEGGRYIDFLEKACQLNKHKEYIQTIIGYLLHEYKDASMAYLILITEQCSDPRFGGGSGKNIFCELLSYMTTYISKPGKQTKFDEKFLQSWNGEKIFAISDIPKEFDFEFFKELSSGTGILKRLFKDESIVPVNKMPKFIFQTQYSFEIKDGGEDRRIRPLEFTEFFTKSGGVDTFYGCYFPDSTKTPNNWVEEDWAGYNKFTIESIQFWLKNKCKISRKALSDSGWVKQFNQTYKEVIPDIIKTYWDSWVKQGWVLNDKFNIDLEDYYAYNRTPPYAHPSPQRINRAIDDYAVHMNIYYECNVLDDGQRGRIFKDYANKEDDDDVPF